MSLLRDPRAALLLFATLILATLAYGTYNIIDERRTHMRAAIAEQADTLADVHVQLLADRIGRVDGALWRFVVGKARGLSDPAALADAERLNAAILYIDRNGHAAGIPGEDLSDEEYFQVHVMSGEKGLFYGSPVIDPRTFQLSLPLSRRIDSADGGFAGIVASYLDEREMRRFFASSARPATSAIALLRQDGVVLSLWSRDGGEDQDGLRAELSRASLSERNRVVAMRVESGGERRHVLFKGVGSLPLMVAVVQSENRALAEDAPLVRSMMWTRASLGMVVMMLALAACWHITRQRRAEAALRESEQRFRTISGNVPGIIYQRIIYSDGRSEYGYMSEGVKAMLGLDAADLMAKPSALVDMAHPEDRDQIKQLLRKSAETMAPFSNEARFILPDGATRWLQASATPRRREDGAVVLEGYMTDVTAHKQLEADLMAAKEDAEQANRAKSEFLNRMSHELRTPLNAILGFAQLLEQDDALAKDDPRHDFARHIHSSGDHLLKLIEEILDLSRIETGRMALSLEGVSIGEVLEDIQATLSPLARTGHVALEVVAPANPVNIHVDRTRLRQVLLNLGSNAIKYNVDGGTVRIATEIHEGRLRIVVADTGRGIPAAKQADVFQPFNRLGAETGPIPGTGIGLTISKRLTEAMGGVIGFRSTEGAGTTFWVDFPREASETRVAPVAGKPAPLVTTGAEGTTVLYVEDNPANLKLIGAVVARMKDVRLISAPNGELGLEMARTHRPDVVILDVHLPGMDGFEILRQLKRSPDTARIPAIALTAAASESDIRRGLEAGFHRYLTKPVDLRALSQAIVALARIARAG